MVGTVTKRRPARSRLGVAVLALTLVAQAGPLLSAERVVREPLPQKVVVLTFDDAVRTQFTVVKPILEELGFSATFFVSEGFDFPSNKRDYMSWKQIAELDRAGFEIGNHTRDHQDLTARTVTRLARQIEAIDEKLAKHGIAKAVSFAYPGNALVPEALPILEAAGLKFARRGGSPEHPYEGGRGVAYEPGRDHPLLIPSAADARPTFGLEDFEKALAEAAPGSIPVFQFHGVPDQRHPWVSTRPEVFKKLMRFLKDEGYRVLALRDLERYVDPALKPADPWAVVRHRAALLGRSPG